MNYNYTTSKYLASSMGAAFLVGSICHYIGITGDWSVFITLFSFFAALIGFSVNEESKYITISCSVSSLENIEQFVKDVKLYSEKHPIQSISANENRLCAWFLK